MSSSSATMLKETADRSEAIPGALSPELCAPSDFAKIKRAAR